MVTICRRAVSGCGPGLDAVRFYFWRIVPEPCSSDISTTFARAWRVASQICARSFAVRRIRSRPAATSHLQGTSRARQRTDGPAWCGVDTVVVLPQSLPAADDELPNGVGSNMAASGTPGFVSGPFWAPAWGTGLFGALAETR